MSLGVPNQTLGSQFWSFWVKNEFSELKIQLWCLKMSLWGPKFGLSAPNLVFLSSKLGLGGLKSELWGPKVGLQNLIMDPEDPQ